MARAAFPKSMADDVDTVVPLLPPPAHPTHLGGVVTTIGGETVEIHGRMYREQLDPDILGHLNPTQLGIALCMYTQNANGYVRESVLRHLMRGEYEAWAVPFVVKLIGEYVPEISQAAADSLRQRDVPLYVAFATRNPRYMAWIRKSVVSYWACYWRSRWPLHEYPSLLALNGLGIWIGPEGRRVLKHGGW